MNLVRRSPGRLFLLALLIATARPALAAAGPRLLAPQAGSELRAGSLATVAWENPPPDAEEWEAFLSLDGGRTYPLRITPHLDLGIRRFSFQVPPFPTREARVLLRFGDERREVGFEAAQRFAITAGKATWPPDLEISLSRGEKPRPRDSGVVIWVEGNRDGRGVYEVMAEAEDCSLRSLTPVRPFWCLLLLPSRQRAGLAAPSAFLQTFRAALPARQEGGISASPKERPSVRLLTGRLNE